MKAQNSTTQKRVSQDTAPFETPEQEKATSPQGQKAEEKKKGKKKRSSVLKAASMARSAVSRVSPGSYRDVDYMHTGTNVSYREESKGE